MTIYQLIEKCQYISIIGMDKNTGKTTSLNRLIEEIGDKKIIGLSSIGRDGEEVDVVTSTAKPRIYVYPNTIIATARDCLQSCDITKEILYSTGFTTPMGEIIIVRALSAGYIDLAGASFNSQNKKVLEKMKKLGCELMILDGALSRSSSAIVSDGTILATGASLSKNMHTVVDKTTQLVETLSLPKVDPKLRDSILDLFKKHSLCVIDNDNTCTPIEVTGIIDVQNKIKLVLSENTKAIAIKSAITDMFIENLIKHRKSFKDIDCIALDGTKFFISHSNYKKSLACGIHFKIINPLNLLFVSYNPYSPKGNYYFDNQGFKDSLEQNISVPVINMREKS